MCRELEALRQSMTDYAKSFDARSLTPGQARAAVRLCSEIVACAGSVKSLAAAVVAEGSSYKAEGYRSPEEQLARETGMSTTQARRALVTGRRMLGQPDVAAAALSGELSPEQAQAVSAGAEANPAKTAELLEAARQGSMSELNEAVVKARCEGVDLEARRRAIHAGRKLSRFTDPEGVYHAFLSGDPGDGITIDQVLTEIRRKLTTSRRQRQIPNDKFDALDYDAMVALFDLACGKDSEISFYDLIDIGLFPQFDPSCVTPCPPGAAPSGALPAPPRGAAPATAAAHSDGGPPAGGGPSSQPGASPTTCAGPLDGVARLSLFGDDGPEASVGPAPPGPGGPCGPVDGSGSEGHLPVPSKNRLASRAIRRLAGRPAKIIIRIDLDTLLRGYPIEGEVCDCPGYGPVPVSLAHDLMATGQARLAGFITKGKELRAVHLDRRHPNEYQKAALDFLYPVCAVKGCSTRAGLEADHREDWVKTHYTVIDLLDYLCWHHHQLKSRQGWALVDGHGKRDFVPPGDPRHPRHRRQPVQRDPDAGSNRRATPPAAAPPPPPTKSASRARSADPLRLNGATIAGANADG